MMPLYFVSVGLSLDLRQNLVLGFTASAIVIACVVKIGSVFIAGKIAGQSRGWTW
jgi:Kef-type K+ transport system membrane component KefB